MTWLSSILSAFRPADTSAVESISSDYLHSAADLAQTVQLLLMHAHRIAHGAVQGTVQSWIKGQGVQFAGIRQYDHGDDARLIDWNTTARLHIPMVKYAHEERNNDVYVVVDIGASMQSGFNESALQTALMMALAVICTVDMSGDMCALLTADTAHQPSVRLCAPLGVGHRHRIDSATRLVRTIIEQYHTHRIIKEAPHDTLEAMIRYAGTSIRKRSIIFLITDAQTHAETSVLQQYAQALHQRHECVVIGIAPSSLSEQGMINVVDAETGATTDERIAQITYRMQEQYTTTMTLLQSSGLRTLSVCATDDIPRALRALYRSDHQHIKMQAV